MEEYVILVDENDQPIGQMEKQAAHVTPHLHRAFSIFIFNSKGELLLVTDSNVEKLYLQDVMNALRMPGITLTSFTIPAGEAHKNLDEIRKLYVHLIEHEFDHVWIGQSDDIPQINRDEVESWKYMSLNDLKNDIEAHPEHYTEWFKITFEEMTHHAAVFQ